MLAGMPQSVVRSRFFNLGRMEADVGDIKMNYHWIGTESLAWPLYLLGVVKELSLRGLCEHFGLSEEPLPHSAIEGARRCRLVYRSLLGPALAQIREMGG